MKKLLLAAALAFAAAPVFSQVVFTYENPDSLHVCGQDTFFVFIKNPGTAPIPPFLLETDLGAGLSYLPGSVSGAAEANISDPSKPLFSAGSIAAGQTVSVKILVEADCSLVGKINAGDQFSIKINLPNGGGTGVTTAKFLIETGLVIIQSISPAEFTGTFGDQFVRTVTVKNTRFGKIASLTFTDQRDLGFIDVAVAGGTTLTSTGTLLQASFDGAFIKNFGDGDALFEKDEVVTFTETVTISDCGFPPPALLPHVAASAIRVGWGCGGDVCSYDSSLNVVKVTVEKSDSFPNITYDVRSAPPLNRCGAAPAVQRVKLKNIGKAPSTSEIFELVVPANGNLNGGFLPGGFRLVSASGAVSALSAVLTPAVAFPNCTQKFSVKATLSLPGLAPGDSLWVEADLYNCQIPCGPAAQDVQANLFYTKQPCPVGGFDSKQFFVAGQSFDSTGFQLATIIKTDIGACMNEGPSYPFEFLGNSNLFKNLTTGVANFVMWLPPGVSLDPACAPLVNGTAPFSIETTGGRLVIKAALPLASSIASMPFCLKYACQAGLPCIPPVMDPGFDNLELPVPEPGDTSCFGGTGAPLQCDMLFKYMVSITADAATDPDCGLSTCNEMLLSVVADCPGSSTGNPGSGPSEPTTSTGQPAAPGDFVSSFKSERINFGLADVDGNRLADLPPANAEGTSPDLRRDRAMTGDTVRLTFTGAVKGGSFVGFPLKFYHEMVESDMTKNGGDKHDIGAAQAEFMAFDTGFVFVKGLLRIKYADGSTAQCPIAAPTHREEQHYVKLLALNISPEQVKDILVSESHEFDLSLPALAAAGCLPKTSITAGDSIWVETDYKIMANHVSAPPPVVPNPPLVNWRNAQGWIGNRQFAWDFYPHVPMQYSGFKERMQTNTFGIRACDLSVEPRPLRYQIFIARPDLFPDEVRPLTRFLKYQQNIPATSKGEPLVLQNALLKYLALQDSVPVAQNVPLPFAASGGFYDIDMGPIWAKPLDEGFLFSTKITWQAECDFTDPDTSVQKIWRRYPDCFFTQNPVKDSLVNTLGFFANTSVLKATAAPLATSQTGSFDIPFSVKNLRVSPAPNSWAYLVDSLGTTSGHQILLNGNPLPSSGGVFQIGAIGSFQQKDLSIKLKSTACGPEKLFIVYGWSCSPLAAPPMPGDACGQDTLVIELQNLATELELAITGEPAQITLCEESDWFEFEVYNAKVGHAFNVEASVALPAGLSLVPGSVQVSYPAGAAWQPAPDPSAQPGNLFLWKINDVLPALVASGLPGVDEQPPPKNRIRIRFKVLAGCGFVAETQPVFSTEGDEPCGAHTNILNKTGDAIHLAGVSPGYSAQVGIGAAAGQALPITCGQKAKLAVNINLTGPPAAGDSIFINLPPGLSFVAGSYVAGAGAPAGPPVFSGNAGRLPLPAGAASVNFTFEVNYSTSGGCASPTIVVQVQSQTSALCAATGQPCGVAVANGEGSFVLPVAHPELELTGFSIKEVTDGHWFFDAALSNPSTVAAAGATVQLWRDLDGDGLAGAGDLLLGSFPSAGGIGAGQSGQVLGELIGDPPFLCSLVVVLPAAENCLCEAAQFPVAAGFSFEHLPLVLCSASFSEKIGIDSTGNTTFQWSSPSGGQFSCPACAKTAFEFPAGALPGQVFDLFLVEKTSICERKHLFKVSFGANFGLTATDQKICRGESVTLAAQGPVGGTFQWSGPGAAGQSGQNLTLSPQQTSQFAVTISLASGCTGTASVTVEVFKPDTTTLPTVVKCPGDTVILGQNISQPGLFSKKYLNANGCDSTVFVEIKFKPEPSTGEQLTLCQGDTALVFGQPVTAAGTTCQPFPAANGCDSTHCITVNVLPPVAVAAFDTIFGRPGDTLTVSAPGGFAGYEWEPPFVNCGNCTSPVFIADSAGTFVFNLTVTNQQGCRGSVEVVFRIRQPCDASEVRMPNAFTPDGDGLNDTFQPVPIEGVEAIARLRVYDRWGEKVYDGSGPAASWDGRIKGHPAPLDVYVWVLDVTCASLGEDGQRVGDVTVVR